MVVKDKVGRHRYILFFSPDKNFKAIKKIKFVKLAFSKDNYGIVKCRHTDKEKVIDYLNKAGYKTIKTSGTIKKLKKFLINLSQS